jgi:hypothetical protein
MKITLPIFGKLYDRLQMQELVRLLESAFFNVVEDRRRGAITVTANYTIQTVDTLVMVAPVASATVTVTVPTVAPWMVTQKWEWSIKLIAAGTLIVQPVSGTIDGTTDATTTTVNTALAIRATNDGWKIV